MTYRIIARVPYERTSYAEPTELVSCWKDGILNVHYALKLADWLGSRDAYYDIDFEVRDQDNNLVRRSDLEHSAHVHAYKTHRAYQIDADFPF